MVPDWYNRPATMQLALGALAVYNLRPDYTPVEEVNIVWALEGNSYIRPTMVWSLPTVGSSGGPSKGFSRRPLYGVSRRR